MVITELSKYDYIDRFRNGIARVAKNNKWGIINSLGIIVVPIEYDTIWKFCDNNYDSIILENKGEMFRIKFDNLSVVMPYRKTINITNSVH